MKRVSVYGAVLLLLAGCSASQDPVPETPATDHPVPSASSPDPDPGSRDSAAPPSRSGTGPTSSEQGQAAPAPPQEDEANDDDTASGDQAATDESNTAGAEPAGQEGSTEQVTLAACGLTLDDISFVQRDWERVVDSVGRGDHAEYTHAFLTGLEALLAEREDCAADPALTEFIEAAATVDEAAGEPAADNALYSQAAEHGNAWLEELGITTNRLAAG